MQEYLQPEFSRLQNWRTGGVSATKKCYGYTTNNTSNKSVSVGICDILYNTGSGSGNSYVSCMIRLEQENSQVSLQDFQFWNNLINCVNTMFAKQEFQNNKSLFILITIGVCSLAQAPVFQN